ncbi:MAG: hypothetical protein ACO29V_07725 [Limnohabitans sp.]|jgi:hypothetical protein
MTYCPDPRPLSPPESPENVAEPHPLWHFLSDDHDHEHWVEDPTEVDTILRTYAERGEPFTMRQLLVTD